MSAPQPSAKSLALVGEEAEYEGDLKPTPIKVKIVAAEKVFSTIHKADGTVWSSVRFKLKPLDGSRAFWTCSMPDEQIGTEP